MGSHRRHNHAINFHRGRHKRSRTRALIDKEVAKAQLILNDLFPQPAYEGNQDPSTTEAISPTKGIERS